MAHLATETKAEEAGFPTPRSVTPASGTAVNHDDVEKGSPALGTPTSEDVPAVTGFEVPDGGWRAWSVVMGSFLVLFSTFGYVSTSVVCHQTELTTI